MVLSDLTFVEDGNPSFVDDRLINWSKRSLLYSVLGEFRDQQNFCRFAFGENGALKTQLVKSIVASQKSPSDLYSISLTLEPRNAPPPPEGLSFERILSKLLEF